MAEAKQVVKPQEAVKQPAAPSPATGAPKAAAPGVEAAPKWKFVKLFGVAQVLRFGDGTSFEFRLIPRNDGSGFVTTSEVVTANEKLANNLRSAAKNPSMGIVEVKV